MHSDKRENITRAEAGEIVAVSLNQSRTGDTLADKGVNLLLENIQSFQPVVSMAVETKTKEDLSKLSQSLAAIEQEDFACLPYRYKKPEVLGQPKIRKQGNS